MRLFSAPISPALVAEALKRKRAATHTRIEGELPEAPAAAADVPKWWSETTTVLDRVRTQTTDSIDGVQGGVDAVKDDVATIKDDVDTVKSSVEPESIRALYEANEDRNPFTDLLLDKLENIEAHLGIVGVTVGTENEQVMANKVLDGGEF